MVKALKITANAILIILVVLSVSVILSLYQF